MAIGRHHEAIFEEGDAPAQQDGFPEGQAFFFQEAIPGKGHEYIRQEQEGNGA